MLTEECRRTGPAYSFIPTGDPVRSWAVHYPERPETRASPAPVIAKTPAVLLELPVCHDRAEQCEYPGAGLRARHGSRRWTSSEVDCARPGIDLAIPDASPG